MNDQPATTTSPASVAIAYTTGDGWPCVLTLQGSTGRAVLDQASAAIKALAAGGCTPTTPAATSTSSPTSTSASAAPICPTHNVAMRPSKVKAGTWFCSQSNGNGGYCREKVSA